MEQNGYMPRRQMYVLFEPLSSKVLTYLTFFELSQFSEYCLTGGYSYSSRKPEQYHIIYLLKHI